MLDPEAELEVLRAERDTASASAMEWAARWQAAEAELTALRMRGQALQQQWRREGFANAKQVADALSAALQEQS